MAVDDSAEIVGVRGATDTALEPPPADDWVMPNADVPQDREHDLSFENDGHAPPYGFWITHPDVLAWTTELTEDDRPDWWVKVWLKA